MKNTHLVFGHSHFFFKYNTTVCTDKSMLCDIQSMQHETKLNLESEIRVTVFKTHNFISFTKMDADAEIFYNYNPLDASDVQALDVVRSSKFLTVIYITLVTSIVLLVNITCRFIRLLSMCRKCDFSNQLTTVSSESVNKIIETCLIEFDKIDKMDSIANKFELPKKKFCYEYIAMAGGGYKTSQYVGFLAYCMQHNLIDENTKFIGSSLGSCCSVLAIIAYSMHNPQIKFSENKKLVELLSQVLIHTIEARLNIFYVCGNWWNMWEKKTLKSIILQNCNDNDVEKMFNNDRLHIICTKVFPYPTKMIFNKFSNVKELIDCLRASCMIPFWSFNIPMLFFRSNFYLDGGFSELIPKGYSDKKYKNLIVYNQTVWYRTFIPLKTKQEYVDDIVKGYIKCKHMSHKNLNDSQHDLLNTQ